MADAQYRTHERVLSDPLQRKNWASNKQNARAASNNFGMFMLHVACECSELISDHNCSINYSFVLVFAFVSLIPLRL